MFHLIFTDPTVPQVMSNTEIMRPESLRSAPASIPSTVTKQPSTPETGRRSSSTGVSYLPRPVQPTRESHLKLVNFLQNLILQYFKYDFKYKSLVFTS